MNFERRDDLFSSAGIVVPAAAHQPKVFILSDLRLLREGVAAALALHNAVRIVGSSDLASSPAQVALTRPDVLLLDISNGCAIEACQTLRGLAPDAKIVAVGVAEDERTVLACARAGVAGFVYPQGSGADIVAAVHAAMRGELACSPRTAGMLLNRVSSLVGEAASGAAPDALTPREQEIMRFLGDGLSNKRIALLLGIRSATVKNHVHNILSKLRVGGRGEAAATLRKGSAPEGGDLPTGRP